MKIKLAIVLYAITLNLYALKPDKNYKKTPNDFKLEFENHKVKTYDDAELNVWKILPNYEYDQETTLIIAYADLGNMSYWLPAAKTLSEKGFTIVMFDYRGFGHSSDFDIDPNYLYYNEFSTDTEAIIEWTKKEIDNKRLGVWALSMGSINVVKALQKTTVDFVVAEGLVTSPLEIKERIKELKDKEIVLPPGYLDYPEHLSKISIPVLVLSGTEDEITRLSDIQNLAERNVHINLITFEGGHLYGLQVFSKESFADEYGEIIKNFAESIN